MANIPSLGLSGDQRRFEPKFSVTSQASTMERQRPSQRRMHGPSKGICQQRSHHPKQSFDVPYFPDFHGPQRLRRTTSGIRPEICEQAHQTTVNPLHGPPALKTDPSSRRLDGMSRHSRCISSHQNASINAKIPLLPSQREAVRVHLSSVRPEHRPPRVHFCASSYHLPAAHRTHKCTELPGRPDRLGQHSQSMLKRYPSNSFRPPRIRLPDPPRKIAASPKPAEGMARLSLGLSDRLSVFVTTQRGQDTTAVLHHPQPGPFLQIRVRKSPGSVSVRGTTFFPNSLLQTLADSIPQGIPQQQLKEEVEPRTKTTSSKMGRYRCLARERTPPSSTSRHNHLDRRVKDRMGSSRRQRELLERKVGTATSSSPHQRSRIEDSRNCPSQSPCQNRPVRGGLHGQRSNLLHMLETRLDQEPPNASNIQGVTRHHYTEEFDTNPQTYSGNTQCPGRRPISPRTHSNRVGTGSTRLLQDTAVGGPPGGRLNGNALQLQAANVRLPVPTPTSSSGGCSLHPLGQMAKSLPFPPNINARPALTSNPELQGDSHPNPGPTFSIGPSDSAEVLGERFATSSPSPQPEDGQQDPHCTMVSICSMGRSAFLLHSFSRRFGEEVAESLLKGFRKSTRQ